MTFDEWFHKEYEPADLQIKQYAENKEGLHIPATVYLEDLKKAFEAGQEGKVVEHFEAYGQCRDSRRIADLEKENAELKEINTYTLSQLNLDNGELIIENEKLKKENAELKDALKGKRCNCMTYLNFKDLEKECAKAKELIRDFISVAIDYIDKEDKNYSYIVEAEQFLKESEK